MRKSHRSWVALIVTLSLLFIVWQTNNMMQSPSLVTDDLVIDAVPASVEQVSAGIVVDDFASVKQDIASMKSDIASMKNLMHAMKLQLNMALSSTDRFSSKSHERIDQERHYQNRQPQLRSKHDAETGGALDPRLMSRPPLFFKEPEDSLEKQRLAWKKRTWMTISEKEYKMYDVEVSRLIKLLRAPSALYNRTTQGTRPERTAVGLTMQSEARLQGLRRQLESLVDNGKDGDMYETGAWRAGTSIFMVLVVNFYERLRWNCNSGREFWFFDSFAGFPVHENKVLNEEQQKQVFVAPLEIVKESFRSFGASSGRVHFVKGFFETTVPAHKPARPIAILRLDGDFYSSTKVVLENFYPKVQIGGWVVIDDYDWKRKFATTNNVKLCREAIEEYREAHGIVDPIVRTPVPSWKRRSEKEMFYALQQSTRQGCKRPSHWCTHSGASYSEEFDCDGDGIIDPKCDDHKRQETGFLGSASSCTDTYPYGVCGAAIVSCGSHRAASCADCPKRDGAVGCKGDCQWAAGKCKEAYDRPPDSRRPPVVYDPAGLRSYKAPVAADVATVPQMQPRPLHWPKGHTEEEAEPDKQRLAWKYRKKLVFSYDQRDEYERNIKMLIPRLRAPNAIYKRAGYDTGTDVGLTKDSDEQLQGLRGLVEKVIDRGLGGDIYETGCWRGGASILMVLVVDMYERLKWNCSSGREFWFFDSFLREPDVPREVDPNLHERLHGVLDAPLDLVNESFKLFGAANKRVHLVKGLFEQLAPAHKLVRPIAILRLDGYEYNSSKVALENFYPQVEIGGFVIINEYDRRQRLPDGQYAKLCREAIDEYRAANGINEPIRYYPFPTWKKQSPLWGQPG